MVEFEPTVLLPLPHHFLVAENERFQLVDWHLILPLLNSSLNAEAHISASVIKVRYIERTMPKPIIEERIAAAV